MVHKYGFTLICSLLIGLLVLAGSCKSDGESSLYSGVYSEGMEHMAFSPHGEEEEWWVNQPPRSLQFLINRSQGDNRGRVLAIVDGERSDRGEYGHMGAYPRQLSIKRVLVRQIPIPGREHGYNNFESTVIGSPNELQAFLQRIEGDKARGWNEPGAFRQAIKQAVIDFQHERLVLFRHTESSGSVRLTPRLSVSGNGVMRFIIDRKAPAFGTADMAYYAYAFSVDTRWIKKAVKVVGEQEKEQFDLARDPNDGDRSLSPLDIRWEEAKVVITSDQVDQVVLEKNERDLLIKMTSGMQYRTTGNASVNEFLKQHLNPDQITMTSE